MPAAREGDAHVRLLRARYRGQRRQLRRPVRQLHRRRVGGPRQGPLLRESEPGQRQDLLRDRAEHVGGHRPRPGRRAQGRPRLGPDLAGRALGHPQQDRRPDRAEPRDARRRRDLGQRQGRARDPRRRHAAGRGPLPLLRRGAARAGGPPVADQRGHGRLPLQGAPGRGRPDHPVELPDPHGDLEAGPRARCRQRRRPQAGRADAGLDHAAHGPDRGPAACRCPQRRQRLRCRGGQAAGQQQPGGQGRLHRGDHHGSADHAVRQPEPDPGHPGAGRQEPERLLRGRDPGRGRVLRQVPRGFRDVRLQPGRGLHLSQPRHHPGVDLRQVPRRRDRARQGHLAGQPAGHQRDDGRPGQQRPAREDHVLRRDRQGRGRPRGHRRRAGRPRR